MLALNMTGDCLRSCAMYITYALEKARNEEQQLEVQSSAGSTGKTPIQIRDAETMSNAPYREAGADPEVSPAQRASRILKLYADTVCLPSDAGNTLKFAKTVTNKVRFGPRGK